MGKRPTMVEIGERAGVSQATVSLVLNGVADARVAAATRERVLAAADALGYRRNLRPIVASNDLPLIGLLLDEVTTTPFAAPFIEGARDEAALHDVVLATFSTRGDPELEKAALDILLRNKAVGILYARLVTQAVTPPEILTELPSILLNCYDEERRFASVVPADVAGAFAATQALIRAGHRRIAHLAGESWIDAARDREQGYRQALAEAGIEIAPDLVLHGGWTVNGGRELTHELLGMDNPPSAIFCFNDRMAIGAYDAVRAAGLSIPGDISIVGFDDEELASYLQPPLTTMVLPHDEMARWAVGKLLDADIEPQRIKLECALRERGSVGTPRRQETRTSGAA